jgi:hypothetical protein
LETVELKTLINIIYVWYCSCHANITLQYLLKRKRILITKQHSIQKKNQSDIGVQCEADEIQRESRSGRRKCYEYFKRVTIVHLIRGISGNIGMVEVKVNAAPHMLEGNNRE